MRELRALVVDDSSLNRRTIAAILREIPGISQVEVASDGADALRVVEGNPPDFITLDLEMPRLDGFEFLQLLMDRHPLPVVVVSGLSAKENVFSRARARGDRLPREASRRGRAAREPAKATHRKGAGRPATITAGDSQDDPWWLGARRRGSRIEEQRTGALGAQAGAEQGHRHRRLDRRSKGFGYLVPALA